MAIHDVKDGDVVLARHITAEEWGDGLKFFSADEEFIQVGIWGYDDDKSIQPHAHNEVERTVAWTQEALYVRSGAVRCHVYDLTLDHVTDLDARAGDILVLLRGGHGYTVLEPGTQVLEIKNGPYVGADRDRFRFQND